MKTVTLNGQSMRIDADCTLADLVASLDVAPQTLATAVNGEFVPREARAQVRLNAGDDVFTFQPITGG